MTTVPSSDAGGSRPVPAPIRPDPRERKPHLGAIADGSGLLRQGWCSTGSIVPCPQSVGLTQQDRVLFLEYYVQSPVSRLTRRSVLLKPAVPNTLICPPKSSTLLGRTTPKQTRSSSSIDFLRVLYVRGSTLRGR
ncbi:hypothetical protein PUNSTDRAFT_51484 [Punctularia strigosozonata HHB-11173 SS5]|uniref:uncharacterized protein n=1 Tax=Punctularia strigosozonata (strain HHB-11173) TaxID=741275 RepID=UPI00044169DA|nr:uncharacterized protein PUNSTDRAFT_51484 [Punctularia strigosozonata HHB-11173 SS5]EIN10911.1 hypothetical protein PUNSTDRAFT_51484 [Punctularia strigosozonata HHB-11173 SS5]